MTAEIGDIVRLRDMRFCFGVYRSMADYFNLKNWKYDYWPKDPFSLYKVMNIKKETYGHNSNKERIVVHTQETTTHQDFMFNMDNLIVVKKPDFLTEEEMTI